MAIDPHQLPIKALFEQIHTFEVPKYQRTYAWDEEAIDDFVNDLNRCLDARKAGSKRPHFFGGVVTYRTQVAKSSRVNQEVIDGQQRLASFIMLAAALVEVMTSVVKALAAKAKPSADDKKARTFLEATITEIEKLYLSFKDNVQLTYVDIPKMRLSQANDAYFQELISGKLTSAAGASNARLQAAYVRLTQFLETYLAGSQNASERAKRIQILVSGVLAEDCTVIFMPSDSRFEATQIFQVLNDRGVHLTDGDLLRAQTLEKTEKFPSIQAAISQLWDNILNYQPREIDANLRWYFSSHEGVRPHSSNLSDQFLESRLKIKYDTALSKTAADAVLNEIKRIESEFSYLSTLGEGRWPYDDFAKVESWDRERLRMLVVELKHSNAMPLLLALRTLDPAVFAEAVVMLERFVFRYKTIGNGHVSPMQELYLKHSLKARSKPATFKIGDLRADLTVLANKAVPDNVFQANLSARQYTKGRGNSEIRYLLATLEDYAKWHNQGAQGRPKCKDKLKVFDFGHTTLEHIYPQNASAGSQDAELEKVKHTLGNLVIFAPNENDKAQNKPFSGKSDALKASSVKMNNALGALPDWTADRVKNRTDELVKMALKVFVP